MRSRTFLKSWVGLTTAVAIVAALLPVHSLPAAAATNPIKYVHDESGRLVGVVNTDGSAAQYVYDKVGNITAINRFTSTQVSIIEFTPDAGPASTSVSIWGTGYSSTPSQNTVKFNGTPATVTSADPNRLVVTVPGAASTGPISVTVGASTVTSQAQFVVGSTTTQPSITGFTPVAVGPGDQLTVTGSNFDSVATNNLVTLGGGVRGGIASATNTQLVVTVPEKVRAGKVSVTTPGGTAVSANDLYAAPPGFTGNDIQSAERMAIGDTKVVNLPVSNKVAMVVFDASEGDKISLTSDTTARMSTGIFKSDGSYLAPPVYPAFHEPPALTETDTYSIIVDPRPYGTTGSTTLKLYSVPPDATGEITVDGPTASISTTVPGQNAVYTFDGTQGQRIAFSGTLCQPFTIYKPDGTAFASGSSFGCLDLDLNPLPATGTYSIVINPTGASLISNMTITLSTQVTGSIDFGIGKTVSLSRAGQDAYLSFEGTQGQKVSLTNNPTTQMQASILKADGTPLTSGCYCFLEPVVLPATGTYMVWVNPPDGHTGSTTLTLYDVPPDISGTLDVASPPVFVQTTVPGQNASFTFDETQGHEMSLAGCISNWTLYKPSGGSFASGSSFGCGNVEFSAMPETGTYRLFLDPQSQSVINKELTISEPITGSISIGGGSVTKTINRSGQNVRMTFDGTASQHVNLTVSGLQTNTPVTLYKPDGGSLASGSSSSTVSLNNVTLPTDGTYSVLIDPYDGNQTSATFSVVQTPGTSPRRRIAPPSRDRIPAPSYRKNPRKARPGPKTAMLPDTSPRDLETIRLRRLARNVARAWDPSTPEEWTPSRADLHGYFTAEREASPWAAFPARAAAKGETAVAGQVLTLNGKPLRNVTLEIEDVAARTDFAGRFLLEDIEPGHEELEIDGASASRGNKKYGFFEAGIDIQEGRTNVLDYTIWMPRLDTRHEVRIPKTTTHEVVVTTPKIPGLELHIPAGKTIEDEDEHAVRRISITAIPVDRPPFPLPAGVEVPIYFTIQPGGAYIEPYEEDGSDGARLIYPNYTHAAPGSRVNFWNYEPDDEGWYIYGKGTVTPDGTQVVPDDGVSIHEFTGAMIANWPPGAPQPPATGPVPAGATDGEPVDLATGLFVMKKSDLFLRDTIPISITRTYRQSDSAIRSFGVGMGLDYNMVLSTDSQYSYGDLVLPDGGRIHYTRITPGNGAVDGIFEAQSTPTAFYKSQISWNGVGWDVHLQDGTTYVFGDNTPLLAIRDRFGNQVTITRVNGAIGQIKQITSPNGRWIRPTYDARNRIISATDSAGRTVRYTYGVQDRLATVEDPRGGLTQYGWDSSSRLTTIQDPRQIVFLTNEYGANDRVVRQTMPGGITYQYAYTVDTAGRVVQTEVTDPRGFVRRVTFNSGGYPITDVQAVGTSEQNGMTYVRNAVTNQVDALTDQLGRRTEYTYDTKGHLTSETSLAGTSKAATTSFTVDPVYGEVTSIEDPLHHTTYLDRNSLGELTAVTDPTGRTTTFGYNAAGQMNLMTNDADEPTSFSYENGDLVSTTDAMGRITTRFVDAAGRSVSEQEPGGSTTRYLYNVLDLVTRITDPMGNATNLDYDPNGNLVSVTDAKNNVTTFNYDSMDRLSSRRDPLLHTESFEYDGRGNLAKVTDRRGQVSTYRYDGLGRLVFIGYGTGGTVAAPTYVSKTDLTYDAGSRMRTIVDSVAGTITRGYDDYDNVTSEQTPQGTVGYTYDSAGRRLTMTVPGQSALSYGYDDAGRLTSMTRGTTSVAIGYDLAGRRKTVTLPDGITQDYGYDSASELTSILYKKGATTLGDLSYRYDASGRRIEASGSFARTSLPAAVAASATAYNANNEMTKWGTSNLTYDLNGNLTGDGTNTYVFNERNQLASIKQGNKTTGAFVYDGLGRRAKRTISSTVTQFLYDNLNPVQELSSTGTVTSNLLSSPGVDDYFARSTSTATLSLLTDGLGSTLATADGTGAIQTSYTYDPYGKMTSTGATSVTALQFTGRENDGNGLQYSRARYYNPALQRFISEDPLGIASGSVNAYQYVDSDPVDATDPLGLMPAGGTRADDPTAAGGPITWGRFTCDDRHPTTALSEICKGATAKALQMFQFGLIPVSLTVCNDFGCYVINFGRGPFEPNPGPRALEDLLNGMRRFGSGGGPKWGRWLIGGLITAYAYHQFYQKKFCPSHPAAPGCEP